MLVYDASGSGHRANYVSVVSRLTGGAPLVAPLCDSWYRLIAARYLILTTFETAPLTFASILLLRTALGKRSALIFLRAHLAAGGKGLKRRLRHMLYRWITSRTANLALSIVPVEGRLGRHIQPIEDIEFWDLLPEQLAPASTDLSEAVELARGTRKVILAAGYLQMERGTGYLCEIFRARPELAAHYMIVFAGMRAADIECYRDQMTELGSVDAERFVSDEELFSIYHVADMIWCCFTPVRDLSSGVFGRAIQFGRPTIVRTDSYLADLQADIGSGIAIPWDAPEEAAALLLGANFENRKPVSRHAEVAEALRTLIHDHKGKVGPICAA